MNDPKRLQQALRDLHGLESDHLTSVEVLETFEGKTVWEGDVEVFRVRGHPQVTSAMRGPTRATTGNSVMSRARRAAS
jgi:hypothetical protein